MSRTKIEKTDTYIAEDERGRRHHINIFTTFTEFTPMTGAARWVPGAKAHKMANGNHVNLNPNSTLIEFETGRKMRRVGKLADLPESL